MLTEQNIPTPGTLDYCRTGNTRRYHAEYECKWATNTVVHILENKEYTGCLVNFKTTMQSYKIYKIIYNPVEDQMVFEDHHEAIIDRETWERVQELRKVTQYAEKHETTDNPIRNTNRMGLAKFFTLLLSLSPM